MLKASLVAEVARLLSEGQSQRTVARALGLSRNSVGSIAAGRHRRCAAASAGELPPLLSRCPRCGRLLFTPMCLACALEDAGGKRCLWPDSPTDWRVRLQLKPQHYERYLRVRAAHEARIRALGVAAEEEE